MKPFCGGTPIEAGVRATLNKKVLMACRGGSVEAHNVKAILNKPAKLH